MFQRHLQERLLFYLIPILLGGAGVLFALSLDAPLPRSLILLVSLLVPLTVGGNLLSRYQTNWDERLILRVGMFLGALSIAVTFSQLPHTLVGEGYVGVATGQLFELVNLVLLIFGMFIVAAAVVRTGEGLTEYGQRFWHLAEHMDEGFLLSNRHGDVLAVNTRMLEFFRMKRGEVIGRNAVELIELLGISNAQEHWDMRQRGMASEYEATLHVDGEERRYWVKGQPILDRRGRHRANLATVRDITDNHLLRERVERYAQGLQELVEQQTRKLAQSEERFRQLLVSMNEGFLTIDAGHRVRFANARICQLLHISETDLLGQNLLDFIDTPDRPRFLSMLSRKERLPRGGSRRELNFVNRDGEPVPTVTAVAFIPASGEEKPLYSLVVTGVGELKRMQRQIERRARDLEDVNEELRAHGRAKDAFLSNVSHELRTPLSTIQGYVEMLESGTLGPLQGPQRGAVQVMSRNVARIIGHINEMIDFSRMEIRGVQLNTALFSVTHLVRDAVDSIHPQASAADIEVRVETPDSIPHAWGDRDKLVQVLGNLLGNAVKFTDRGGRVQIIVGSRESRTLTITVSDNGIGIEPAYQERVFEKFFQVDSSKTRRYEGTGIGLTIAQSITVGHGGVIELESVPGEGTAFTVVLPNALFDMTCDVTDKTLPPNMLVLCINRNRSFREVIDQVLGDCGCRLEHFESGGHGCLRKVEELRPNLVIINEPPTEEHWRGTVGLLRESSSAPFVPVVVFHHADDTPGADQEALFSGVYHAPKPFDAQTLVDFTCRAFTEEPPAPKKPPAMEPEPVYAVRARVLVLDSDPGLLEWMEAALTARGILCDTASTPEDALALAAAHTPDLLLLDIDVAGPRAVEHLALFRQARETHDAPVCVMSGMPPDTTQMEDALAVLHKPFSVDDVLVIIHELRGIPNHPVERAHA